MTTKGQIVRKWRDERGMTTKQVADLIGTSRQNIENLEADQVARPHYLHKLAKVMGYTTVEELIDLREPPHGEASRLGVAHDLSLARPIVPIPRLQWGDLVREEELPGHFELEVLDDAMAPIAPKGSVARFARGLALDPGKKPVLLRDRDGHCYIRHYQLVRATRWQAVALQPGFGAMDSEDDGLTVLAVMKGIDWA